MQRRSQVEAVPTFHYLVGRRLRVVHDGKWVGATIKEAHEKIPNMYTLAIKGSPEVMVVLTSANHAAVLEPALNMRAEYSKYCAWIRSNFAVVVDALSGVPRPPGIKYNV